MSPSLLSLTPLNMHTLLEGRTVEELKASILESSTALAESLRATPINPAWSVHTKVYNGPEHPSTARSSSKKVERGPVPGSGDTLGFRWHSRTSIHPATSAGAGQQDEFSRFEAGLLRQHSMNEKEYIESCCDAQRLAVLEEGVLEVWRMSYHLPVPTSNREFVILILTVDTTPSPKPGQTTPSSPRSFQVVSIPIEHPDAPLRSGWERGKYVSVEELREEEGSVVWRMATASDAGGLVPKFITEMAMPSKVSEDVPSFVAWKNSRK